jgi:hypothetical protein
MRCGQLYTPLMKYSIGIYCVHPSGAERLSRCAHIEISEFCPNDDAAPGINSHWTAA